MAHLRLMLGSAPIGFDDQSVPTAVLLLEKDGFGPSGAREPDEASSCGDVEDSDRWLLCVSCGHRVALASARVERCGAHLHTRVNPGGFAFEIGCFDQSSAIPIGSPSEEFAWFPHCTWRVALCGGCQAHLGWHFAGPEGAFFGLRVDMLVGP